MKKGLTVLIALYIITFWMQDVLAQNPGMQSLKFGSIDREAPVPSMDQTYFYLSGKKMYEVGLMNGAFPIQGDKSVECGIWSHPMKFLDSFQFLLSEDGHDDWTLINANSIEHNFYSARLFFSKNDLSVIREDFIVEDESVLFSDIQIKNNSSNQRKITFSFSGRIDIRPSWRAEAIEDKKDSIFYNKGQIVAFDNQGALVLGCNMMPSSFNIEENNSTLIYSLTLPANGSINIPFLVAGDNRAMGDYSIAYNLFNRFIDSCVSSKDAKQSYYEQNILHGVKFECSNKKVTDAFYCAKANMLMNTRDARPFYNDLYFAAGVPVYPRLFGTDFCFSTAGLISGGFNHTVRSTLNNVLHYTKQHLRGPHEIGSDGQLLGWDHVQVCPQFVAASWEYYAWTRDKEYLEQAYPICKQMIEDLFATADDDHDLYIQGHGLMEEKEFKGDWEELTTSAYMYPALESLSNMARELNEDETAQQYKKRASAYKKNFNRDWWGSKERIWAGAFSKDNNKEFSNFWNVVFPQKVRLANDKYGQIAMNNISDNWINDTWGMVGKYTEGENIADAGVGVVHNNICATAAFNYGYTDLGWKLIELTAKAPLALPNFQLGLFPECQPHGCTNISQLWSYAPFVESVLQGLVGINPINGEGNIEIYCHIPEDLEWISVDNVAVVGSSISIKWKKDSDNKITFDIKSSKAGKPILLRIPLNKDYSVLLNGKNIKLKDEKYYGSNTGVYLIK